MKKMYLFFFHEGEFDAEAIEKMAEAVNAMFEEEEDEEELAPFPKGLKVTTSIEPNGEGHDLFLLTNMELSINQITRLTFACGMGLGLFQVSSEFQSEPFEEDTP